MPHFGPPDTTLPPVGQAPAPFTATTVDGDLIDRDLIDPGTLVAFFSAHCGACREQLPHFVDAAATTGRDRMIAIVTGRGPEADELVAAARAVARVVQERENGPVTAAFGVTAFPTFARLGAGSVVLGSALVVDDLPVLGGQ